jgi:thiamine-phosphate pyrophosphorylase
MGICVFFGGKMERKLLKLYAITDGSVNPEDKVRQALQGGATIVQYRVKDADDVRKVEEATKLLGVCKEYKVPLIINDDVMLALKIGADGVHVGQNDMSVIKAREILGDKMIIGATAKTVEQAKIAEQQGADYLGSGAVFGSTTKTDALPMSKELLSQICSSVTIPVVAIGGINKDNIDYLEDTNISGVAVIDGIFGEDDITATTEVLYNKIHAITGGM